VIEEEKLKDLNRIGLKVAACDRRR
jgi:hypothetical protein